MIEGDKKYRLLCITISPSAIGGLASFTSAFGQALQSFNNLDFSIGYTSTQKESSANVNLTSLLSGRFKPQTIVTKEKGITLYEVGCYFPKIEYQRYSTNTSLWKPLLNQFEMYQVVSGYALDALPLALLGVPYCLCVATDLDSEREAQLPSFPLFKRLAITAQMGELRRLERFALEKASRVFTLCETMKDRLIARGANPNHISILPFPITPTITFRKEVQNHCNILWVCRLSDTRKNTPLLLRAFARIAEKLPAATLSLVGPVTDDRLMNLARELGIANRVNFLGELSEEKKKQALAQADIFAIPSLQEGLCISGLEAMACGIPVVSTRCVGPEAFIIDGITGFLVGSEEEMAIKILELTQNKELYRRISRSGVESLITNNTHAHFLQIIQEAYSQIWPEIRLTGGMHSRENQAG